MANGFKVIKLNSLQKVANMVMVLAISELLW
jgi:hypothetical protein